MLEEQRDRSLAASPPGQDGPRHTIGDPIQRAVGKLVPPALDREPIGVRGDLLLEAGRDRLLDVLLPELDEGVRRAHALGHGGS
jgi:hypothetical protein